MRMKLFVVVLVLMACGVPGCKKKAQEKADSQGAAKDQQPDPFEKMVGDLGSSDASVASKAVEQLTEAGENAVPALIAGLGDKNETVQLKSAELLGKVGGEAAVNALAESVRSSQGAVRTRSVLALEAIGDTAVLDAASQLLKHEDYKVRIAAVGLLKKLPQPETLEVLLDGLMEKHGGVRNVLFDAVAAKGPEAIGALKKRLSNATQVDERRHYLVALGRTRNPEVAQVLLDVLDSEEARLKNAAACALSDVKAPEAVPPLLEALDDPNAAVRACAARALGTQQDTRAVRPLITLLTRDDVHHVKAMAAYGLGRIGDEQAVRPLLANVNSENRSVRYHVVSALSNFKSKAIPPALVKLLGDEDVGQHVQLAMVRIGENAMPVLINALRSTDDKVAMGAVSALGRMGDTSAVKPLIKLLESSDDQNAVQVGDTLRRLTGKNFGTDVSAWKAHLDT